MKLVGSLNLLSGRWLNFHCHGHCCYFLKCSSNNPSELENALLMIKFIEVLEMLQLHESFLCLSSSSQKRKGQEVRYQLATYWFKFTGYDFIYSFGIVMIYL